MKPWLRLTLITMTVGGGFAGFAETLQYLFSSGASTLNLVMIVVSIGMYVFVTASGLMFALDPRRTGPLVPALAAQILSISSSIFVYKFAAGIQAFIIVGSPEKENTIGAYLGWDMLLGSSWRFGLLNHSPLRVGVNVAAIAILVLLLQTRRPGSDVIAPAMEESAGSSSATHTPSLR